MSEPPTRIGEFLVEAQLGHGGFGDVFRVRSPDGRGFAAKVLHAELCQTPEAVARFEREAELLIRLRHPAIVALHQFGRLDDGRPFLVMELLDGSDLDAVLAASGPMTVAAALDVLDAVAGALEVAHAAGAIHRDIKASNVFLDRRSDPPRVVLLDFGVAKLLDPDAASLTGSLVAIGTPTSMAPEQIRGGDITARTDVYGLASLAFQLLTGAPPFRDPSPTVLQQLHLHARRPRASAIAEVPAALDLPLARGLDRDAERRPSGPGAFVASLRQALAVTRGDDREVRLRACVRVGAPPDAIGDDELEQLDDVLDELLGDLRAVGLAAVTDVGDTLCSIGDVPAAWPPVLAAIAGWRSRLAAAIAPIAVYLHVGSDDTLAWVPDGERTGVLISAEVAALAGVAAPPAEIAGWHWLAAPPR